MLNYQKMSENDITYNKLNVRKNGFSSKITILEIWTILSANKLFLSFRIIIYTYFQLFDL